jgi:hypothetical protein
MGELFNFDVYEKYRVRETNPLPRPDFHKEDRPEIYWEDLRRTDRIELERLRFVTDPGFPVLELSYCYLIVNGQKRRLVGCHPFYRVPKKGWKRYLVQACKDRGIFIKYLIDNTSILWG